MRRKHNDLTGRILVAHEKHATRLFDASSVEKLHEVALQLLKERLNYYIQKPDRKVDMTAEDREYMNMTDDAIRALPVALQKHAESGRRRAQAAIQEKNRELAEYTEAARAVKEKDGNAAWEVLQGRMDYEYEKIRFEWLENA